MSVDFGADVTELGSSSRPRRTAARWRSSIRCRWLVVAVIAALLVSGAVLSAAPSGQAVNRAPTMTPSLAKPRLVFESDFLGTMLNPKVWDTCYPWVKSGSGCTNFGNLEYEWYLPSQVRLSDGVLNLVAQPLPTQGKASNGAPKTYVCRSGMVTTYPGLRFQYGLLRVVARLPSTRGLWSGVWLGATTFQWPPEIDLIEYWGTKTNGVGVPGVFFHPYGGPRLAAEPAVGNLSVGWHTFALDWTPTQLTWSIDGRVVLSTNQHVPQQPMFLVVDLAYSSGNLALMKSGAGCHGTLYVKSVKLWQE